MLLLSQEKNFFFVREFVLHLSQFYKLFFFFLPQSRSYATLFFIIGVPQNPLTDEGFRFIHSSVVCTQLTPHLSLRFEDLF